VEVDLDSATRNYPHPQLGGPEGPGSLLGLLGLNLARPLGASSCG
jgi:hypothetical protein